VQLLAGWTLANNPAEVVRAILLADSRSHSG